MLNIYYGDMEEAVYNTAVYFKNTYEDNWITEPIVRDIIKDVDKSEVIDSNLIESPVLGKISPLALSGGTKTLILIINDKEKIFNASTCGNNCAKWLLKISENEDVTEGALQPIPEDADAEWIMIEEVFNSFLDED